MHRDNSFIAAERARRRSGDVPIGGRERSWRAVGAGWAICLALFGALAGAGGVHRLLESRAAADARPAAAEAAATSWRGLLDAVSRRG